LFYFFVRTPRTNLIETAKGKSHEGSIGNLCTKQIKKQMQKVVGSFPFAAVQAALEKLVK
jgi:hypothetical protein